VVVTEIDPFRIEVAKRFNVPVFNPYDCDLEKEVIKLTNDKKFDIVIDAVGTQLENALDYVTAGGKILAFGMDDSVEATISPYQITRKAIKILGSYIGQNTILPSIKLLAAKKLELDNFFTETIPLKEGPAAFKKLGFDLATGQEVPKQAMKIVLKP
jgi:threonine dehydrogenase-like Zn-dependent dehydrogenase